MILRSPQGTVSGIFFFYSPMSGGWQSIKAAETNLFRPSWFAQTPRYPFRNLAGLHSKRWRTQWLGSVLVFPSRHNRFHQTRHPRAWRGQKHSELMRPSLPFKITIIAPPNEAPRLCCIKNNHNVCHPGQRIQSKGRCLNSPAEALGQSFLWLFMSFFCYLRPFKLNKDADYAR